MTDHRSMVFGSRRIGLSNRSSVRPLLSQVQGKAVQPAEQQKINASSFVMKEDSGTSYDPLTAPPESSDDEAENAPIEQTTSNDSHDSDEDYVRRRTADIRATSFGKTASTVARTPRPSKPKIRPSRAYRGRQYGPKTEDPSVSVGSKRAAEDDERREPNQLEKELEGPRQKKKRQLVTKYGTQPRNRKLDASQPAPSTPIDRPISSSLQDKTAQCTSPNNSFHRAKSITPLSSQSPRKAFKDISGHSLSPISTPGKHRLRRPSPVDQPIADREPQSINLATKGPRKSLQANLSLQRKKSKRGKPSSDLIEEAFSQAPVFKMPGLEDIDSFDDSGSLDASENLGESQDMAWDHLELEETESTTIPRCPMCYQKVDRELLEKYSVHGKMSVKQQTAFCRLHKQQSAARAGTEKGYPQIDWEALRNRCRTHQRYLQSILEGTRTSHYRKVLKEKVDSGKNRTLLTSHDNLTPGYYGPRGLQIMTEFIMSTLSDVIRRRAIEDKLISVRSYTGYVQAVLVPELTVRLIMEDMSITEERARDVLDESVEIGELLHEEMRDVVMIDDKDEDSSLEV